MAIDLANLVKIVGDENRFRVLSAIFNETKICVSEVARKLKMSQALTSHHLRALEAKGVLKPVKEGKKTCYLLVETAILKDFKKFASKYR